MTSGLASGITIWCAWLLRAELRARDRDHERAVQLRAGEWFEAAGDARRAARHFLAAQQPGRALALLQDRVVPGFLRDPALPAPLDLAAAFRRRCWPRPRTRCWPWPVTCCSSGDPVRGGQYLDLVERARPPIAPGSELAARYAAMRAFHYAQAGRLEQAVTAALAARAVQDRVQVADEWPAAVALILLRVYPCLEDYQAVEREAARALALPGLTEPARLVLVAGARALAWAGRPTWPPRPRPPGPRPRRRRGWVSASTSSPWITCAPRPRWRWNGVTSTPPSG